MNFNEKDDYDLRIRKEELLKHEGYKDISDKEAEAICDSIYVLSLIILNNIYDE